MNEEQRCLLCEGTASVTEYLDDWRTISCERCGQYEITDEAQRFRLSGLSAAERSQLSGTTRHRWESTRQPLRLTTQNIHDLLSAAPAANDVPTKVRYLLRHLARKSKHPGDRVELKWNTDFPVCLAGSEDELRYYAQYLADQEYVLPTNTRGGGFLQLTPNGWEETHRVPTLESHTAFVAMSFSKAKLLKDAYEQGIEPGINDAGYDAVKIDREHFLGDVVFELIVRIKESRFVVADVTEHKNGVYFEGGYAMGMGLPVIWMCHKKDLDNAHFDTSHLNHIVWEQPSDVRKTLADRILATIGRGPRKAEK